MRRLLPPIAALVLVSSSAPACGGARASESSPTSSNVHPAPRPVVVAHRGGAHRWPEETLYAFEHARALGDVVVDLDLRRAKDGVAVVIHDDTVDRTTDGSGRVDAMTFAELRGLDAGYCFVDGEGASERCKRDEIGLRFPYREHAPRIAIPRLEEVLEALPKEQALNLELKDASPELDARVVAALRAHDRVATTCVGSFDDAQGARLREALEDGCVWAPRKAILCAAAAADASTCGPWDVYQVPIELEDHFIVDEAFVGRAHEAGARVEVWTIDEPVTMRRLLGYGVDAIFTDDPDLLRAVLRGGG